MFVLTKKSLQIFNNQLFFVFNKYHAKKFVGRRTVEKILDGRINRKIPMDLQQSYTRTLFENPINTAHSKVNILK